MWVEVVLLVLLLLLLKKVLSKPDGLPPGWWGLPFIGYIPLNRKYIEEQLMDLYKKHGKIYLWRWGSQVMIFVHDYQLCKEIFNRPDFVDRPDWITFNMKESPALGVVSSNGARWNHNRRFTLRQLRDLGMGKSRLVGAVHKQAVLLVEELKKQAGQPAPLPHTINIAIVNIIWQMVAGIQFEMDDPRAKEFQELLDELITALSRVAILDFLPWMKIILPASLVSWICRLDTLDNFKEKMCLYFKEVIDEHQATLDRGNSRDLIDSYLIDMEEKQNDSDSTMNERDLMFLIMDLFTAGSQTTRDTLKFALYYLGANPEVQTKLQDEIDQVLAGAPASLEDRARMPYTEAVIHEVLRSSSLASTGAPHVASTDTRLAGYIIPKGAIINSMVVSMHDDPLYWEDHHAFKPERWLDDNGRFTTKKEGFMPFSVGKRQCAGEGLARMELFIFLVTLMQNLNITPPPGKIINPEADPKVQMFHVPYEQDVLITVRE